MTYWRSRSVISEKSDVSFSQDDGGSVFDVDEDQSPGDSTEPSDISGTDSGTDDDDDSGLHRGNVHPPEYFLRMQEDFNEEKVDETAYAPRTTLQLDGIEWRWNAYCKFTNQDPKYCMHNMSLATARAFFTWIFAQKTGQKGRRLRGIKSLYTLNLYWKEFRLVYERETRRKIDPVLNRKMKKILRGLSEKHGLTGKRRENRRMTVEDLKREAETAISTTKMRFRIGEHQIAALLFYQLLAPTGARPESLLFLRYGDIVVSLARDLEGRLHLVLIRFSLYFTKIYLGAKET